MVTVEEQEEDYRIWRRRYAQQGLVLDRATCDWIVDEQADTAICRQHGEVADGPRSAHFPGGSLDTR